MHSPKLIRANLFTRFCLLFRRTNIEVTDSGEVLYYKRLFGTIYITNRAQIKWPGQKEPTP